MTHNSEPKLTRRSFLANSAKVAAGFTLTQYVPTLYARDCFGHQTTLPDDIDCALPIGRHWDRSLADVASLDPFIEEPQLAEPAVRERHKIFTLVLMKLVHRFFNGNKLGPAGEYGQRPKQRLGALPGKDNRLIGRYQGDHDSKIDWDRYVGHNIACMAVNGRGEIVDFEFNHNAFFDSSAEHAEARLVRRLYALSHISEYAKGRIPADDRPILLRDYSIYTSLESCAQCSGIMSLAQVKEVVFLQHDPGQFRIGNIMYKLAGKDGQHPLAPLPIPANERLIGLRHLEELDRKYAAFAADQKAHRESPFFTAPNGGKVFDDQITSFLCTDDALEIFKAGAGDFDALQGSLNASRSRPTGNAATLTNEECLVQARLFYEYASKVGMRGSPHES